MLVYLSLDFIWFSKITVYLELRPQKTIPISEQILSADKHSCIFLRQMAIIYLSRVPTNKTIHLFLPRCRVPQNTLIPNIIIIIHCITNKYPKCCVLNLRICSCLAWVYRAMDERGNFGEHEKCVRVARGAAESNSSFLSDNKDLREEAFHCDRVQNSQTAQKKWKNVPIDWSKTRHILYFCFSVNIWFS